MTVPELETAVRAKANFVSLIFEDSGYGVIRWKQLKRLRADRLRKLGNPNFAALRSPLAAAATELRPRKSLSPFSRRIPAIVRHSSLPGGLW